MSELACLDVSVLLWVVHVLCQVAAGKKDFRAAICISSRDKPSFRPEVMVGRATRALAQLRRKLHRRSPRSIWRSHRPALVGRNLADGVDRSPGSSYLPLYLFNVIYVRSIVVGRRRCSRF